MAVRFGAALGAVVVAGAGCGGTLEGPYRRGELGTSTTTRAPTGTSSGGATGVILDDGSGRAVAGEEPSP